MVITEMVPMPDCENIKVSYNHLVQLEKMGIIDYIPDGSTKKYKIKVLLGNLFIENKNEEEILLILRKLKDQTNDRETATKILNDIVLLQPNFFGIGININNLINKI